MKINIDDFKEDLDKIYKEYIFLNMPLKEYYELCLVEINNISSYLSTKEYKECVINNVKRALDKKINELLLNDDTAFELLCNYINYNFKLANNYENDIKDLVIFCEKYSYFLEPNIIIELLNKNGNFLSSVEKLFNSYKSIIVDGNITELFENDTIISIIELYCMINKIDINNGYKEEINETVNDALSAYLKGISKYEILSVEAEKELAIKVANGDMAARKEFIEKNLKLVVSIAKRYRRPSISLMDLILYGNIGLITAVDKFDVSKGYKFSTYAAHWIKNEIMKGINENSRNVVVSNYKSSELRLFVKAVEKLRVILNRDPSAKEISEEIGYPVDKVMALRFLQEKIVSLNEVINEDGTEIGDLIASDDSSPQDELIEKELPNCLEMLLEKANLNEKELMVLKYRYGFYGQGMKTLDEIGKIMHVTRERARQIEAKALFKLRRSVYTKELAIYTDDPDRSSKLLDGFLSDNSHSVRTKKIYDKSIKKSNNYVKKTVDDDISYMDIKEPIEYNLVTDSDYSLLMDFACKPEIRKLLNIITFKELSIYLLHMGYINNKKFTIEAISNFYHIDEQQVIDILKNILLKYRAYLTNYLSSVKLVRKP